MLSANTIGSFSGCHRIVHVHCSWQDLSVDFCSDKRLQPATVGEQALDAACCYRGTVWGYWCSIFDSYSVLLSEENNRELKPAAIN